MQPTQATAPRRGFGCLGYGCLVSVAILTVVLAIIGLYLLRSIRGAVDTYSSPQPPQFVVAPVEPGTLATAEAALKRMRDLLNDPKAEGTVSLSSAELSAASRAIFGDVAEFTIEGAVFRGRFSLQLEKLFGDSAGRFILGDRISRFVYGNAAGTLALKGKVVEVQLSELELSGRKQEDQALVAASSWVSEAVTSMLSEKPEPPASGDAVIDRLSELALRDGSLTVSFRPRPQ